MNMIDEAVAKRTADTISLDGIEQYQDAWNAAQRVCRNESDSFVRDVATQLWHRAFAEFTARENAGFLVGVRAKYGQGRITPHPTGLALDPATYAWVQQHRTLVAALMKGEAVVAPK